MPEITVLMAVYNGERYLGEAIESILGQSYGGFEFLIVDDASTDGTSSILKQYALADKRIRLISNESNLGLSRSLNRGLELAKGAYIARMDADDIARPERFATQLVWLKEHPEILVLGSAIQMIDENGCQLPTKPPPYRPIEMRWASFFGRQFVVCHPTAMIRRELFDHFGFYAEIPTSQDLELWSRLMYENPYPIANLEEILLDYRVHSNAISTQQSDLQFQTSNRVRQKVIEELIGHKIEIDAVSAYRIRGVYRNISEFIHNWIEVYAAFFKQFPAVIDEIVVINAEFLERLGRYIYFNPLTKDKNGRFSFYRIRKIIPPKMRKSLLDNKRGKTRHEEVLVES
ncbi:MAG: glycosyltransferase family 2 protein [Syntrophomonadaceae bacterium]